MEEMLNAAMATTSTGAPAEATDATAVDDPFQLLRDLPVEDDAAASPTKRMRGKASASGSREPARLRAPAAHGATPTNNVDISAFFPPAEAARYNRNNDARDAAFAARAALAAEKARDAKNAERAPPAAFEWPPAATTALEQLVQMGFDRAAADACLIACAHDVAQAATLLAQESEATKRKREELSRRDKSWVRRGALAAKDAGPAYVGPAAQRALLLQAEPMPTNLVGAPSIECVWEFIEQTNGAYDVLHEAFERQFWGARMALSSLEYSPGSLAASKEALEAFLRDPRLVDECQRLRAGPFTSDRQKKILGGFLRVFECNQMDAAGVSLRRECVVLEHSLSVARKECALGLVTHGRFEERSAGQLRTLVRTHEDEAVREAAWRGLRRVGPAIAAGLCELVQRRNAMARALGFADFYDYKVTRAEGFGKVRLFEILDRLRDGTASLNANARNSLDETARQPWNAGFSISGDAERALDPYFPFGRSLEAWGASFARMGIKYRGATMTLDLLERRGKYGNGFCHWPQTAWVRRNRSFRPSSTNFTSLADPLHPGAGRTALKTLMHEAGHAAHFSNISQESPLFAQERAPTSVAYAEAQAMFLDSLVSDAAWRSRYAKSIEDQVMPWALHEADVRARHPYQVFHLRALLAVPYFERALYEHAALTPEAIVALADRIETEISGGLAPRPLLSVPHLLADESACSYHGYVLAEMAVQQTRRHFGSHIVDNPDVGQKLTEVYWRPGNTARFVDLVKELTGEPLSGNAWTDALSVDVEDLVAREKRAYMKASSPRDEVEIDLDMRIKIVDGDDVIADSEDRGGFMNACKAFEVYLEKRYGNGVDHGHHRTPRDVAQAETPPPGEGARLLVRWAGDDDSSREDGRYPCVLRGGRLHGDWAGGEPVPFSPADDDWRYGAAPPPLARHSQSASVVWGLDKPAASSVEIARVGRDMLNALTVPMTEGDRMAGGGVVSRDKATVAAVRPMRAYERKQPTDRSEWTRWANAQAQFIGRGADTSCEEWRARFGWRGCDAVAAGPSCLDRRRKKAGIDAEKQRLRDLPKLLRALGDRATDAFLEGDASMAADLRAARVVLVEERAALEAKYPRDPLLRKLRAIGERIDMVAAPMGAAVRGGYADHAHFCGRSLLPLFDERDKLERQLAARDARRAPPRAPRPTERGTPAPRPTERGIPVDDDCAACQGKHRAHTCGLFRGEAAKPAWAALIPAPAAHAVRDRAELEARMAADGWTTEEKAREGSYGTVDRYFLPPGGGKRLRSIVEVARQAYPEFLMVTSPVVAAPAVAVAVMPPPGAPAAQGGRVRRQPRLPTGPAPAALRLATRVHGVSMAPARAAGAPAPAPLAAWPEDGLRRMEGAYNPLVRLPNSVLPKSLFPSRAPPPLPPSRWRPGQAIVVPALAFGAEWALENPGEYAGTIVELDEESPAGRTWLVEYADGPTETDENFFIEAPVAPAAMEEDEASGAPAAPPDPLYQEEAPWAPLCDTCAPSPCGCLLPSATPAAVVPAPRYGTRGADRRAPAAAPLPRYGTRGAGRARAVAPQDVPQVASHCTPAGAVGDDEGDAAVRSALADLMEL